MSFNELPLELKLQIIEQAEDYRTASMVSKEWRYITKTKKIMQSELDKYVFFYIIWYTSREQAVNPCPNWSWHNKKYHRIAFVFPIASEEQFTILKKFGETKNSQVAAVERPYLRELRRGHWFFLNNKRVIDSKVGNTETLVERIQDFKVKVKKNSKRKYLNSESPIYQYLREKIINANSGIMLPFNYVDPVWKGKVKFMSLKLMKKLLQGEHAVVYNGDTFCCKPRDVQSFVAFVHENYARNDIIRRSLSKSLIRPRWAYELKPGEYEEM